MSNQKKINETNQINTLNQQNAAEKTTTQIEAIVHRARKQIEEAKKVNDVDEILAIRGKLLAPFISILNLSDEIEGYIKDLKLPKGTYGVSYIVRVSDENRRKVNDKAIFTFIEKELGLNPLDYAKADTTNQVVKDLLEEHTDKLIDSYTKIKKHSFKPF